MFQFFSWGREGTYHMGMGITTSSGVQDRTLPQWGWGCRELPCPTWYGLMQLSLTLVLSGPFSLLPAHGPWCCRQSVSCCPGDELKAKPVLR